MNSVILIGRLTRDPEVKVAQNGMSVATFTIAIDRPAREGVEKQADFPRITCFGKQAEICEKCLAKGRRVAVEGRLQTGSYQNKSGDTIYITDVIARRVEILDWPGQNRADGNGGTQQSHRATPVPRTPQRKDESSNGFQKPYFAETRDPRPVEQQTSIFAGRQAVPKAELPPNFEEFPEEVPF